MTSQPPRSQQTMTSLPPDACPSCGRAGHGAWRRSEADGLFWVCMLCFHRIVGDAAIRRHTYEQQRAAEERAKLDAAAAETPPPTA